MPVQTPDTEIGDAYHAAVVHQMHRTLRGYGWVNGGAASAGPGVAVTVPESTTMWIDGTEVDVSSGDNSAQLLPHDRWPRWASIVVNDVGEVQALHSEPDRPLEVQGEELTGRNAPRPSPPIVTNSSQALHSLVWIPANASSIDPEHVVDRRIDARVDAYNFGLDTYSDADAVAAVEAEDPLDLAGDLNVGGALDVSGTAVFRDSSGVSLNQAILTGQRTTAPEDQDNPVIYRTGNAGIPSHPRYGDINIVPRTSVNGAVRILTGSPTPSIAFQVDASSDVTMGGDVSISGTASHNSGETLASHVWVDNNAVQNNTGNTIEIQKDGTDGQGVLNFKTQ